MITFLFAASLQCAIFSQTFSLFFFSLSWTTIAGGGIVVTGCDIPVAYAITLPVNIEYYTCRMS